MKKTRILIPTDFSQTADKARNYAIQLAELLDAEIVLLNSYHIPYTGAGSGTLVNIDQIARETAERGMEKQIEYVHENYPDLAVKSICIYGGLVDVIKKLCTKDELDLIVMGTTGASGFVGNLLGSNTAALIGAIKTPILAVPHETEIEYPKNVVISSDLIDTNKEGLFSVLQLITEELHSKVDFLYVVKDKEKTDETEQRLKAANLDELFDMVYHPFHFRKNENVEEEILSYIDKKDTDLLVVISHERSFWESLFHKSITKSLTKQTKIPILILHD